MLWLRRYPKLPFDRRENARCRLVTEQLGEMVQKQTCAGQQRMLADAAMAKIGSRSNRTGQAVGLIRQKIWKFKVRLRALAVPRGETASTLSSESTGMSTQTGAFLFPPPKSRAKLHW